MLTRILNNIISNSIKFTNKGSITITCSVDHSNFDLIIKVSDTGLGIKQEKLENIIKNVSAEKVELNKSKGVGLGITIIKRLCDKIGAKFLIDSKEGAGTECSIVIPRTNLIKKV